MQSSSFSEAGTRVLVSDVAGVSTESGGAGSQSSQREMAVSAGLLAGGVANAAVSAAIPRALNIREARMETVISAECRRVWLAKG
jgi:uncharacterized protein (DUF697 family)